jgi:hypothetical protein
MPVKRAMTATSMSAASPPASSPSGHKARILGYNYRNSFEGVRTRSATCSSTTTTIRPPAA